MKNDLNYIHNNPNEYMKERRREIKETEEDIIYIEGILSTLKPYNIKKPIDEIDENAFKILEKEVLTKKENLENLILEKNHLEKEKIKIENKQVKAIDTTEFYKKKLNLEKGLEIIKIKEYKIDKDIQKKMIMLENEVKNFRREYVEKGKVVFKEGDSCPTCKTIISKHHLAVLEGEIENALNKIANLGKEKANELKKMIVKEKELEKKFNTFKNNRINEFEEKIKVIDKEMKKIEKKNSENLQRLEICKEKSIVECNNKINLLEKDIKTITIKLKK